MMLTKDSIFWTDTNEERRLLEANILYHEVKKCPKLSHVLISFEGYEDHLLNYQILLAHKKKEWTPYFSPIIHFKAERVHSYKEIELCDFQLSLETVPEFFRSDDSIHLFKARKAVVSTLTEKFGPIRDYYGALIKEKEKTLHLLKEDFPSAEEEFVEEFFFSLRPSKIQALLSRDKLREFFEFAVLQMDSKEQSIVQKDETMLGYFCSRNEDVLDTLKREFLRKGLDLHSIESALIKREQQHFFFRIPESSS